ncbi:MAG: hypothetical protein MJ164_00815 [Alphaproteobacteria bacterium]|nr:hypothetical protein [Alphaproteobacteria bacterium]
MKKIIAILSVFCCVNALADDTPQMPAPRVSLFSTTVDWSGVTGLPLSQYSGKITGGSRSLVKNGLVLYYLDAFPCYGAADSVRVWVSPSGEVVGNLRLICVANPKTVQFAYHNATADAPQSETTGLLTCPATGDYDFNIDLSKCTVGPNWSKYGK